MDSLVIPVPIYYEMVNYCLSQKPMEACGFLSGSNQVVQQLWPIQNTDKSPVSFTMDNLEIEAALETIRDSYQELYAMFHSHPTAPPYPSAFDIDNAHLPCSYVIVSLAYLRPRVKSFKISQGIVNRENIYLLK